MVVLLAAIALSLSGCSKKSPSQPLDGPDPSLDAGLDAQIDDAGADVDAPSPTADCERAQREYVNKQLAPDQQVDVSTTVSAVLRAADFSRAMPYCSGDRPIGDGAATRD